MSLAATHAADRLRPRLGPPATLAIVLGTGLGDLVDAAQETVSIPYGEIEGFPPAGVSGHAGRLVAGTLGSRRVLIMQGRAHYYETGDAAVMRPALEVLQQLGVRSLLLTNAAGSLRREVAPGALSLVSDHINLAGTNPLIGDRGDGRFVPLTQAYSPAMREGLRRAAAAEEIPLAEGVYAWVSGPSFETPAEIRMLGLLGADLVGMSTVPEVIIANRLGLEVAALSIVTNLAAGIESASPSHAETKEVAAAGAVALRRLLLAYLTGADHG